MHVHHIEAAPKTFALQFVHQLGGVLNRVDDAVVVAIFFLVVGARLKPQPQIAGRFRIAHAAMHDARFLSGVHVGIIGAPPERTGEHADRAEDIGMIPRQIEGHQAAQREAHDGRVHRAGQRAIAAIDVGQHFVEHEEGILARFLAQAARIGNARRAVLLQAIARGVDGDHDDRLDLVVSDQRGQRLGQLDRGHILPVVDVQHFVMAICIGVRS